MEATSTPGGRRKAVSAPKQARGGSRPATWCARPRQKFAIGSLRDNKMLRLAARFGGKASLYAASVNGCPKQKATKEALVAICLPEVSFAVACWVERSKE